MLFLENAETECGVYAFSTFLKALLNGLMAPKKSKKNSEAAKLQVENACHDTVEPESDKSNEELSSAESTLIKPHKATATPSVGSEPVGKKKQTQIPDGERQEKEERAEATRESAHSLSQTTIDDTNNQEAKLLNFTSICNAWFNSTCYHAPPPGIPPGICNFVLIWRSIPHPRARRKRQFPTPGTPHRPQIRCFVYKA